MTCREKVNRFVRLLSKRLNVKKEIAELFEDYAKESKNNEYETLIDWITEVHLSAMVEVLNMPRVLTREEQEKLEKLVEKFNINRKWEMKGDRLFLRREMNISLTGSRLGAV